MVSVHIKRAEIPAVVVLVLVVVVDVIVVVLVVVVLVDWHHIAAESLPVPWGLLAKLFVKNGQIRFDQAPFFFQGAS